MTQNQVINLHIRQSQGNTKGRQEGSTCRAPNAQHNPVPSSVQRVKWGLQAVAVFQRTNPSNQSRPGVRSLLPGASLRATCLLMLPPPLLPLTVVSCGWQRDCTRLLMKLQQTIRSVLFLMSRPPLH